MALAREDLENLLVQEFDKSEFSISDLAGDNDHWSVEIKSAKFKGLSRIDQHKLVYKALGGKMGNQLHALQIKTFAI